MKLRDTNLQVNEKKLIHTSLLMYFAFILWEYITITSSEEALKMCEHYYYQEIKRKVVLIYLLSYDSCKSTLFKWNLTFSSLDYSFCQIN